MISAYRLLTCILITLLIINNAPKTDASSFSAECVGHVFMSAYDSVTDTCWIAEKTSLVFQEAITRCTHLPGYSGHLGFPMTAAQRSFIYTHFSNNTWIGWVGIYDVLGSTYNNASEYGWLYPNGSYIKANTSVWLSPYPKTYPCASPNGANGALVNQDCTTAQAGFYCQYDHSTGYHESLLQHKCKQLNNFYWYEDCKSCITFSGTTTQRPYQYAKIACNDIPGFRGHLVHVTDHKKLVSLMAILMKITSANTYTWVGLEQDATATGLNRWFWTRPDGYRLALNTKAYRTGELQLGGANQYVGMLYNGHLYDTVAPTARIQYMCEYEESSRYTATDLEQKCAALQSNYNSSFTQFYYKGTCYVRDPVARTCNQTWLPNVCTHIPGYTGQLAVIRSLDVGNVIYQTLIINSVWWSVWVGLRRYNSTGPILFDDCSTNCSQGWYWSDRGNLYPSNMVFDNWAAGHPAVGWGDCGGQINNQLDNWFTYNGILSYALCEYSEPTKGTKYTKAPLLNGKQTVAAAIIRAYDDLPAFEMCAYQCTKEFQCRSIVHNQATKQCRLQASDSYDSTVAPISVVAVAAPGFVWYDKV